jgi:hypothetical protein
VQNEAIIIGVYPSPPLGREENRLSDPPNTAAMNGGAYTVDALDGAIRVWCIASGSTGAGTSTGEGRVVATMSMRVERGRLHRHQVDLWDLNSGWQDGR